MQDKKLAYKHSSLEHMATSDSSSVVITKVLHFSNKAHQHCEELISFLDHFLIYLDHFTKFFSYLSLVLGGALPHQRGMVDQTIFGRVMFRLECPEQRLLRSQDLDGGGRVFCQIHEGTFREQIQRCQIREHNHYF